MRTYGVRSVSYKTKTTTTTTIRAHGTPIRGPGDDKVGEMTATTTVVRKASSQSHGGVHPSEEAASSKKGSTSHEALKEFEDTKRELDDRRLEMDSLFDGSSDGGIKKEDDGAPAYSSPPSPAPSYCHSAASSEVSEEL